MKGDMRLIDLIGLISYAGIVVNLVFIAFNLNRSMGVQIRNNVLLYIVVFVISSTISLCGAVALFFYNRIEFIAQGKVTPIWVTDTSVYFWAWFFLSLTGISWLYLSKNTRRYFKIRKGKEWE